MRSDIMIQARNLTIGYRQGRKVKKVHTGLSFALRQGELTCLLGPNGAGKSTLLRTLGGTQAPLTGDIFLEGRSFTTYTEKEISRKIGLVLTDRTMAGGLTVFDLVSLGRHPHTGFFGRLQKRDEEIVYQSLDAVGVAFKAGSYVAELSDGERQKVMIAKALAQECPLLLLDEPTAFLDVVSRIEMMDLLHELAEKKGKTVLLSTHDLEQALLLGDRLWLLSRDKGLVCGATEDLVFSGEINQFFARNEIIFDRKNGNFRPQKREGKKITLKAEGELFFWTQNALTRNGFQLEEQATLVLEACSPHAFRLWENTQIKKTFTSFEQLIAFVKQKELFREREDILPEL